MRVSADYLIKFVLHDAENSPYGGAIFCYSSANGVVSAERRANGPIKCMRMIASSGRGSVGHYRTQRRSLPVAEDAAPRRVHGARINL